MVVDQTNGKKPESLRELLGIVGVDKAATFPDAEKKTTDADLIVFLGTDAVEKFK